MRADVLVCNMRTVQGVARTCIRFSISYSGWGPQNWEEKDRNLTEGDTVSGFPGVETKKRARDEKL